LQRVQEGPRVIRVAVADGSEVPLDVIRHLVGRKADKAVAVPRVGEVGEPAALAPQFAATAILGGIGCGQQGRLGFKAPHHSRYSVKQAVGSGVDLGFSARHYSHKRKLLLGGAR